MIQINRLILTSMIVFNILLLCSCNRHTHNSVGNHLQYKQYLSAKEKLNHNNYKDAIKELENLNKQHPLNPYKNQIYFDLIYAYYKSMDFSLTLKNIDDFIKSNPEHPNTDYPLYIKALSNMELDNGSLPVKLRRLNQSKKNPEFSYQAFHSLSQLINKYPNSQYTSDAHKRLIFLKNRIAEYELSVIEYYSMRGAYITVINRSEDMLRCFPDTKATLEALEYMYRAYKKLYLIDQSNKVMQIIAYNK